MRDYKQSKSTPPFLTERVEINLTVRSASFCFGDCEPSANQYHGAGIQSDFSEGRAALVIRPAVCMLRLTAAHLDLGG